MKPERARSKVPVARPWLPDAERYLDVFRDVLERRYLSNFSRYCELLERRASEVLEHPNVLCASSCDVAMVLAWRALGLTSGEVIVPSFTFCSTVNAMRWNGLAPVFADVDPATLCVSVDHVRELIGPRTVAIAAVHTFGRPAPIAELEALAKERGLALLFDAAHGLGARAEGRALGSRGDASVFSLSGTKLVTAGEGGLVTFRDPVAADRFLRLRAYGFVGDYNCREVGLNSKLSELNAGLGWVTLGRIEDAVNRRQEIVAAYAARLRGVRGLEMQSRADGNARHAYKDFAVLFPTGRARLRAQEALAGAGVETKRYFLPVHTMDAYRAWAGASLPVTTDVYDRILCLPIFHEIEEEEIEHVSRTILHSLDP